LRALPSLLAAVALAVLAVSPVGAAPQATAATVEPPTVNLTLNGRITDVGVPLTVSWPDALPSEAAVDHYELQRRLDFGPWTDVPLPSPLANSVVVETQPWKVIVFRVRAVDTLAQPGDWAESSPHWMTAAQESHEDVDLSAGWTQGTNRKAYLRRRATTTASAETATYEFTGREVAWVSRVGPTGGQADVSTDGESATSVSLVRSAGSTKRVVFTKEWSTTAPHVLNLTTTSSGGVVEIDAFIVLADATGGTLVGSGDISTCTNDRDAATAAVVSSVLDQDESAWAFTAGDNVYPDGSPQYFADCYDPTWGVFKGRTHPVIGNHEKYNNPGGAGYFAYFGAAAGNPGEGWYKFDVGTWRVYALSSECKTSSACYASQYNWLRTDLANEPHACVMAIWHRPRWSTGPHGSSTRMASVYQLLYDNGAELVVTGHDHTYQRFAPADPAGNPDGGRGMRQFVVGTGGAALYGFNTDSSLLEVRQNHAFGVLKVTLTPGGYAWEFMPAAGYEFSDTSADTCH
jgi:Calcineurin-like phosphoesterase